MSLKHHFLAAPWENRVLGFKDLGFFCLFYSPPPSRGPRTVHGRGCRVGQRRQPVAGRAGRVRVAEGWTLKGGTEGVRRSSGRWGAFFTYAVKVAWSRMVVRMKPPRLLKAAWVAAKAVVASSVRARREPGRRKSLKIKGLCLTSRRGDAGPERPLPSSKLDVLVSLHGLVSGLGQEGVLGFCGGWNSRVLGIDTGGGGGYTHALRLPQQRTSVGSFGGILRCGWVDRTTDHLGDGWNG